MIALMITWLFADIVSVLHFHIGMFSSIQIISYIISSSLLLLLVWICMILIYLPSLAHQHPTLEKWVLCFFLETASVRDQELHLQSGGPWFDSLLWPNGEGRTFRRWQLYWWWQWWWWCRDAKGNLNSTDADLASKNYHQMCFRQTAQLVSHFPFLLWQERHNLVTDMIGSQML